MRLPISPSGRGLGGAQDQNMDGGWSRNRTGVHGVAVRCITTLPSSLWSHVLKRWSGKRDLTGLAFQLATLAVSLLPDIGARNEIRPGWRSSLRPLLFLCYQIILERETRFELATLALARRCSTTELFPLDSMTHSTDKGGSVKRLSPFCPLHGARQFRPGGTQILQHRP